MKKTITAVLLALSLTSVHAGEGSISVKSEVFKVSKVKQQDGSMKTKLLTPSETEMLPKDEIIYINTVSNISKQAAEKVVVHNPIPPEVTYKADSAEGSNTDILFSIDGGKNYATANKLTVKDKNGEKRQAKSSEYTHIQWTLNKDLQAGQESTVSFRAYIGKES